MRLSELKKVVAPFLQLRHTTWDIEIFRGASPFALRNMDQSRNPVITAESVTDVSAEFVADPFIVRDGGVWYMFFETLVRDTKRGVICLATSADGLSWTYERVVMLEPLHLSYSFVFPSGGSCYMIP